jgi:hypothetical protein
MKFKEAVKHLEDLGLTAVMPDGTAYRTRERRRFRNPIRPIAVQVLKNGNLPEDLREMIRQSRAETRAASRSKRTR